MPVRTARGFWSKREGLLVRLEREDGHASFGECAPIPWFGTETVGEAAELCADFDGRVNDVQIDAIPEKYGCLRFAFESARNADAVRLSDSAYLPVAALLPAGRGALDKIGALGDLGFRTFKWKVGVADAREEIALLDDVLAELPSGSQLRLDANGAWSRRDAEHWLAKCADRPIEFLEQPVAADACGADDLLSGLAEDYPTPIALDESIVGASDASRWLESDWPGIFVIKPALLGDARRVINRLPAGRIVFSSALETFVGAGAALRMAFEFYATANINSPRALGFGVWPLFMDKCFDGPPSLPFLRAENVANVNVSELWNALI